MSYVHGGDWAGYMLECGTEPLDFSANVSPLGLPEGVRKAIINSLDKAERYPDPMCRALKSELAKFHDVEDSEVLCGNGAADLIYRLVYAIRPKKALVTAPCFAEYGIALGECGCCTKEFILKDEDDFHICEDILDEITRDTDIVILCEPNNPTGVTTDMELLLKILRKCRDMDCLLAVDECFNQFLDEPSVHTLIPELEGGGLIIFRAFTKFYGMAGIRLGYCLCSDDKLMDKIENAGQPWTVSTPAQEGGIAAIHESEYSKKLRSLIKDERGWLITSLEELGCRVIKGEANYLLFHCDVPNLDSLTRRFGVLIRPCSNYEGLSKGWYRIAVRTHEENMRLMAVLREVL